MRRHAKEAFTNQGSICTYIGAKIGQIPSVSLSISDNIGFVNVSILLSIYTPEN